MNSRYPGNLFFIILFAALLSCNPPAKGRNGVIFRSAKDYNNYIIDRQKEISQLVTTFYARVNTDLDSAEPLLAKGLYSSNEALEDIKGMPAYKGDSLFRNAAIRSFGFYKNLFDVYYPRIIDLRHAKDKGIGESSVALDEQLAQISKRIINEEEDFDKDLHNTQKEFAEKNNMKLVDSSPSKKYQE